VTPARDREHGCITIQIGTGLYRVLQSGSQRLWDEVHTIDHWWVDAGAPPQDSTSPAASAAIRS